MLISDYLQENTISFPIQKCQKLVKTFGYSRGVLPHLSFDNGLFFVTTRLFDSIPYNVVAAMRQELGLHTKVLERDSDYQITQEQMKALLELWKRLQDYEDAGHGKCFLRIPRIATMVVKSLKEFATDRYDLLAWSVMPNHLHFVLRLLGIDSDDDRQISKRLAYVLQQIKGFTAFKANQILGRRGEPFWQREFFDRYIRSEQHLRNVVKYIINNPIKAGVSCEFTGSIFDDII